MAIVLMEILYFVIMWAVLIFSVSVHECCHALAAYKMGDDTGYLMGRITLNPIKHIDLIWTIIMPLSLLLLSGGRFAFGGAKPVPINPSNFRDPDKGFMISSLAGPLSNFTLILIGMLGYVVIVKFQLIGAYFVYINSIIFYSLIAVNVILCVFNLIPIPPLDGSRILRYFLPWHMKEAFDRMETFGLIIIFFIVFSGGTAFISVILNAVFQLLDYLSK